MLLIKSLIISNNNETVNELKSIFKTLPIINDVLVENSIYDAMKNLNESHPSLIFADLNSFNEIEREILNTSFKNDIPLIAVSGNSMDAVDCYNTGIAIDFILKPFTGERVRQSINRALTIHLSQEGAKNHNSIFVKVGRTFKRINLNEITFIEAYGIYSKIYTNSGKIVVNDAISKLESKLKNNDFLRVHKSYIINTTKINSFNATHFAVQDQKIPIGISYKSKLEGLMRMLTKEMEEIY